MLNAPSPLALALLAVALIFGFVSGLRDAANIVATMISSRAIGPRAALITAALAAAISPFIFGVNVATTLGREFITAQATTSPVVLAGLIAAIAWNALTAWLGTPSSSLHALVGGLLGAAIASNGWNAINPAGVGRVLVSLLLSPVLGLLAGFVLMRLILLLARGASPRINIFFKRGQVATVIALALAYGANDGQKTIGVMAMALIAAGSIDTFQFPFVIVVIGVAALTLGMSVGGWRLIRTLGGRFYTVRPVHAFSAQVASAVVVLGAALAGGPVSTTQVVSTAIMGAGSAERLSKVRWHIADSILTAWLLTLPVTAALAAGLYEWIRTWPIFA